MYTAGKPACSTTRAVRQSYAPGATTISPPASSERRRAAARVSAERGQRRLGHLLVFAVVAAAHADPADDLVADRDRVAAAEHDEAIDARRRAVRQRRVVLDEVVPAVRRHAEADGGVGLVLRDLHAQQRRTVHAAERLQYAVVVDDGDHERLAELGRLRLRGRDQPARRLRRDRALRVRVRHLLPLARGPRSLVVPHVLAGGATGGPRGSAGGGGGGVLGP